MSKEKSTNGAGSSVVRSTAGRHSLAGKVDEVENFPPIGNVIEFPGPADEPQAGDGDGGDGTEIVIRIVVDWPDAPEDSIPAPKPERKSRLGPFLWGALIGWWLGG